MSMSPIVSFFRRRLPAISARIIPLCDVIALKIDWAAFSAILIWNFEECFRTCSIPRRIFSSVFFPNPSNFSSLPAWQLFQDLRLKIFSSSYTKKQLSSDPSLVSSSYQRFREEILFSNFHGQEISGLHKIGNDLCSAFADSFNFANLTTLNKCFQIFSDTAKHSSSIVECSTLKGFPLLILKECRLHRVYRKFEICP